MKQILMVLLALLLMIEFSSSGFTEENKPDLNDLMNKGIQELGKVCQGKEKSNLSDMMMGRSLVVTPDGGVVVLIGNKLYKYDKDLVLQKEVEIKIDRQGTQKKMGKSPMGGNVKSGGGATGETKE